MKRRLGWALVCLALVCPAGAQAAEEPITRGELAVLLWTREGALTCDGAVQPFADLAGEDNDLVQAAAWGYGLGLMRGTGDALFAPHRVLTREEYATVLRRYDAMRGRDVFFPEGAAECNDALDISPWADDSLYWACATGRMDFLEGRLAPLSPVTPAQGAGWLDGQSSVRF